MLLESGTVSVSSMDGSDEIPLCIAAGRDGLRVVGELLAVMRIDVNVNTPGLECWPLLLFSCTNGHESMAKVR